jgi:hypothetical protein
VKVERITVPDDWYEHDLPHRDGRLPEDRRAARGMVHTALPADTIVEVRSLALPELMLEIE